MFTNDINAGKQSQERILLTEELSQCFQNAQKSLSARKTITIPRAYEQLWIVTDSSVSKRGTGAKFYISHSNKLSLVGFFSAKLRKLQVTWLPAK